MDTFQSPNRGLKDYVEDSDDKLTFGIVYSSQVDTDLKLPYIFPIGEFIRAIIEFRSWV